MARNQELIINTRLGKRRINTDKILHFPRGLAGFEDKHEFTLLQIRPESPFLILQSMEEASLGLMVADPYSFMDDYQIKIGDAEQTLLQVTSPRQVAVLVTVSIPPGKPEEASLNLTGPILINHEDRVGLQVPQADDSRPSRKYLNDEVDAKKNAAFAKKTDSLPTEGETVAASEESRKKGNPSALENLTSEENDGEDAPTAESSPVIEETATTADAPITGNTVEAPAAERKM